MKAASNMGLSFNLMMLLLLLLLLMLLLLLVAVYLSKGKQRELMLLDRYRSELFLFTPNQLLLQPMFKLFKF